MKHCNGCSRDLSKTEFSKKHNGLQSRCKTCCKEKLRNHYLANKEVYITRKKLRRLILKEKMADLIIQTKSVPCRDCKHKFDQCAMTFDHLRDKIANISDFASFSTSQKTMDLLEKELSKCDVVCSNCHQIREWNRRGSSFRPNRKKKIEILQKRLDKHARVAQLVDASG